MKISNESLTIERIIDTNLLINSKIHEINKRFNISDSSSEILIMIGNKHMSIKEIVTLQNVDKASITRKLKYLKRKELIEYFAKEEQDKRLKYIKLTSKGKDFNECIKQEIHTFLARIKY